VFATTGRVKTNLDREYVQINPITDMTEQLFEKAIRERQLVSDAKDKFGSQSAITSYSVSVITNDSQ